MTRLFEVHGAGNRFVLWDARDGGGPSDPVAAGRALTDPAHGAFGGRGADGLLLVLAAPGADARLVIVNRDGSRPEMCGNGLRCVARHLAEGRAEDELALVVLTDAGLRPCNAARRAGEWRVAVQLGAATVGAGFHVPFPGVPRGLPAFAVDVGNPHAVLDASHLGVRLADAPLAEVAAATLATGLFPEGVNVELVEAHGDHLRARVFERGVGETAACGTGAGAIAAVALRHLGHGSPVRVLMPGGLLELEQAEDGTLWLAGPTALGGPVAPPRG